MNCFSFCCYCFIDSEKPELSNRFKHITAHFPKAREYVRIYILSTIQPNRENQIYITFDKKRSWGCHYVDVDRDQLNFLVYDHFINSERPKPQEALAKQLAIEDENEFDDMYLNTSDHVFAETPGNNNKGNNNKNKNNNNNKQNNDLLGSDYTDPNKWFEFSFRCLHNEFKKTQMIDIGDIVPYTFKVSDHAVLVMPSITENQAIELQVESGIPSDPIPAMILLKHWIADLQILSFETVIKFVRDLLPKIYDQLYTDVNIRSEIQKQLTELQFQWDLYRFVLFVLIIFLSSHLFSFLFISSLPVYFFI